MYQSAVSQCVFVLCTTTTTTTTFESSFFLDVDANLELSKANNLPINVDVLYFVISTQERCPCSHRHRVLALFRCCMEYMNASMLNYTL